MESISLRVACPLVSVIIPTHNRPEMLAEALGSVRAQTFTDYEVLIVSNGENADMRQASQEVAAPYGKYFERSAGNVSSARNFGIELAKGKWIAFLDDDDLWLPAKLEQQAAEAERTGADMVSRDYIEFFSDGREIARQPRLFDGWSYTKALSQQYWWAAPSAVMVRKRLFDEIGGFDPRQRYSEDNDMWRISRRHTIHQMNEILMRHGSGN
jgi:glycosyltransferase involved in cell wall biosynthesis